MNEKTARMLARVCELPLFEGVDTTNINSCASDGDNALHVVVGWGDPDNGADLFALSEGDPPFTSARLAGRDEICDFLAPLMKEAQSRDPKIWVRSRIAQLQRELGDLKAKLEQQ